MYARRRCTFCKAWAVAPLRSNKRIHWYPFFCVSFTRVICYDQLTPTVYFDFLHGVAYTFRAR